MWLWIFFYSIIFLRIYISIISPIQKDNVNILKFPSERHIIENSKDILINLMNAVDETVKDKEIRSESKEIIMKMSFELTDLIENGKNKISNLVKEEEE